MTKKEYKKPVVTKVRLDLKTSVLAVCSLTTPISPTGFSQSCQEPVEQCFSSE